MSKIELSGYDFGRIMRACAKACDKQNFRKTLQYIELRACGGECVATSLDGVILQQIKVHCDGDGVILIPGTVKPPKCERAIIEDANNIRITYLDGGGNLIYAYELPKYEEKYFDWKFLAEKRDEETIHCNARNLRNALVATSCADDEIISISIPKNKDKAIRVAANDVQVLVIPVRVRGDAYNREYKDWYKPTGGRDNG